MNFLDYRQNSWLAPSSKSKKPITFGNGFDMSVRPKESREKESEDDSLFNTLRELYNKDTPAMGAYKQHLDSAPVKRPAGKMNAIFAAMAGIGAGASGNGFGDAYNATREVRERPYLNEIDEYKTRGSNLGALAELESADLGRKAKITLDLAEEKRKIAKDRRDEANERRLDTKLDIDLDTNERAGGMHKSNLLVNDARIAQMKKAAFLAGKSIHTNEIDGQLVEVDLATGATTPIGKFSKTWKEKRDAGNADANSRANHIAGLSRETHRINRLTDVNNPLPNNDGGYIPASQSENAHNLAVKQILLRDPSFEKFIARNDNGQVIGIVSNPNTSGANRDLLKGFDLNNSADKKHWDNFQAQIKKAQGEIESKRRPGSQSNQTPVVNTPSPLNPPTVSTPEEISLRNAAIEEIKKAYSSQPEILQGMLSNEEDIAEVMERMKNEATAKTSPVVEPPPVNPATPYVSKNHSFNNFIGGMPSMPSMPKFDWSSPKTNRNMDLRGNLPANQR